MLDDDHSTDARGPPLMPARTATPPPAAELRMHLDRLLQERDLIRIVGLSLPDVEADLDDEIIAMRGAYIGAAVTEIASLRAELSARLQG
jgi:hypothetical protein